MMMMMTMFQIFKKTFQVQVFHNFHHQAVVILTFEIFAVLAEVYLCDLRGEVRPAVEVVVPWWSKEWKPHQNSEQKMPFGHVRPPKKHTGISWQRNKIGICLFLCGFYVNCDLFFSSCFSVSHSRWLCESEAAQWFGWKNWEFGGWEWWEPCYLAQGLRGVKTKSIWSFCRDAGGLRNRCQTKIKVCLWKDGI